jgi:hypothetical protein
MDDFKEKNETKLKPQVGEMQDLSNGTSSQISSIESTNLQSSTNDALEQRIPHSRQNSATSAGTTVMAVLWIVLFAALIAWISNYLTTKRSAEFNSNGTLNKMSDLKNSADRGVLVKIKGLASKPVSTAGNEKIVFQFLRATGLTKYSGLAEERFPQYFSVDTDQGSILINSSQLAEFVEPKNPSNPAEIIDQLRTPKVLKILSEGHRLKLWTIHEGDEVTAEGQVAWDDKQKSLVLNAPSLMVAPLSAGLIKLRVKNGPETF